MHAVDSEAHNLMDNQVSLCYRDTQLVTGYHTCARLLNNLPHGADEQAAQLNKNCLVVHIGRPDVLEQGHAPRVLLTEMFADVKCV